LKKQTPHNDYFLADWLAGRMSDAELRALVGDVVFQDYAKIRQATELMPAMNKPIKPVWSKIEAQLDTVQQPKTFSLWAWTKKALPYAAVLVVLLGIYQFFNISQVVVHTAANQQKTIWLTDDIQIVLASNSTLKYAEKYKQNNSKIYVEGAAFISNRRNQPLHIYTPKGHIVMTNARIGLQAKNSLLKIENYKGNVYVKMDKQPIVVPAKSVFYYGNKIDKLTPITQTTPAWLTNVIAFDAVPLANVLDSLEQYYHIKIDRNTVNTQQLYSGKVPKYDLSLALITVLKPMQIDYKMHHENIKLIKQKSGR